MSPEEATGPLRDQVLAEMESEGRRLAASAEAYRRFAIMAAHLRPAMDREPHLALGFWVPDHASGEIWAGLVLDHVVAEAGGVATLEDFLPLIGQDRSDGARAIRTDVERCTFPAGEAVLVVDLEADAQGALQVTVQFTIFPDECRDALQLNAITTRLEAEDILIGETAVFMDHLAVLHPPS